MKLKKSKSNKTENIHSRCTEEEKNKMQTRANLYTNGNLSEYILFAALNFVPNKEDLEEGE